jgi:streptomycin 6-kinase
MFATYIDRWGLVPDGAATVPPACWRATAISAAWYLSDGDAAEIDFRVAALAAAELDR